MFQHLRSISGTVSILAFVAALDSTAFAQEPASSAPASTAEIKGLPPRAAPTDYQAHAQAGTLTIAAEFTGHSIAVPEGVYLTEDYVVVEVGLFGPPEMPVKISTEDFSLRINGKKSAAPAEPYGAVFASLKDPEWEPPESSTGKKSKGGLSTGGGGGDSEPPPAPVRMPIELKRAMQLRVQKAALREGERVLPEAGLLFFPHGGKIKGVQSLELIYAGAQGKAVIPLHP